MYKDSHQLLGLSRLTKVLYSLLCTSESATGWNYFLSRLASFFIVCFRMIFGVVVFCRFCFPRSESTFFRLLSAKFHVFSNFVVTRAVRYSISFYENVLLFSVSSGFMYLLKIAFGLATNDVALINIASDVFIYSLILLTYE